MSSYRADFDGTPPAPRSGEEAAIEDGQSRPEASRASPLSIDAVVAAVDKLSSVWARRGSQAALFGGGAAIITVGMVEKISGLGDGLEQFEFVAVLVLGFALIGLAALFTYLEYRSAVDLFKSKIRVWESWEVAKQKLLEPAPGTGGPPESPTLGKGNPVAPS